MNRQGKLRIRSRSSSKKRSKASDGEEERQEAGYRRISQYDDLRGLTESQRELMNRSLAAKAIDLSKRKPLAKQNAHKKEEESKL